MSDSTFAKWMWACLASVPVGIILAVMGGTNSILKSFRDDNPGGANFIMNIGMLMIVGGVGGAIYLLAAGVLKGQREFRGTGQVLKTPNYKVIAKYVYNNRGEMVHDEYLWDAEPVKFYVRFLMPNNELKEFQTARQTFETIGEAMTGEIAADGKWLGSFTPYVGRPGST